MLFRSREALDKRHAQGWVKEKVEDIDECIRMIQTARRNKAATSIGFLGADTCTYLLLAVALTDIQELYALI